MKNWSVTLTVPISATRPTSLRPRSSSIRCSARSFGSASSSASSALSSCGVAPRGRVPAMRADRHGAVARLDQDFRARSGDGEVAEVEKEQIRRRVDPAQRAVERERRQRERRLEALRQHHLEDVAGGDVLLGAQHHAPRIRPAWCWSAARRRAGPVDVRRAPCRAAGRAHRRPRRAARPRAPARPVAETPASGRTGVTTVIVSFTASNTITMVGRISIASGMPIGSGLGAGNSSISRTMS